MEQEYKQLFVGGDLSGIQKFLYNISSKKAAVSLKGRSFYLQQYMDNVCKKIKDAVNQAGAKHVEVIYNSGGKFYLLTDNSMEIRNAIDECSQQIKKELWKEHMGQLGINISYAPFTENADGTVDCEEKKNQKPGCLWKAVNADFHHQKSQKFKNLLIDSYQDFFEPLPVGGQTKVCAVTGIESPDCVKLEDIYILPLVKEQIQLGEELRDLQHFKTFEEYAGDTKLGILRMDVDGLGKRFIVGFRSIQEYKAFSKRLVSFFEEKTQTIQKDQVFRDYLNIIYAGGDDLFIIGRWDKVIEFAERIHQEVEMQFGKDGITISGGIAIVNPKFPIAKGAESAGEAEYLAKSFRNGEKNALCFLGKTVSWNEEFAYVKSYQQQFTSLIQNYGLSKGILHKLMLYASIADQNKVKKREGKPEDFSYIWHISYYLNRFINRYKSNEEVCAFCRQLRDKDIDYKKGRNLELIALAARWAELLLRDTNN